MNSAVKSSETTVADTPKAYAILGNVREGN